MQGLTSVVVMGGRSSGRIDPEWLADARLNEGPDSRVEDWFGIALNQRFIEIDKDGSLWVEGPSVGRWLPQFAIDDACARIDRGV